MTEKQKKKRSYGKGSVLRRPGTSRLYLKFSVHGFTVCRSTRLEDSPENWEKAELKLDEIMVEIRKGIYDHSKHFPDAPVEEKREIAQLMGRSSHVCPADVDICNYAKKWIKSGFDGISGSRRRDYLKSLNHWILPHFKGMSFKSFTQSQIITLVEKMKKTSGYYGLSLSKKTICNTLIPARRLWRRARDEYDWDCRDPFEDIADKYPIRRKITRASRKAFRWAQFRRLINSIPPFYRPMVELMLLMGLLPSEASGIKKTDVHEKWIYILGGWTKEYGESDLKTGYRLRKFKKTRAIRKRLNVLMKRPGSFLFTTEDGSRFNGRDFRKKVWDPAVLKSGISRKVPYALRHSFVVWSLLIGVLPINLYKPSGHTDTSMIYKHYSKQVEKLVADREAILRFMGADYVAATEEEDFGELEIE